VLYCIHVNTTTFSVRVGRSTKSRLEKLAKNTGRSRSFLAAEAISAYLDSNEWQVAGIAKALASLDRGKGIAHARVSEWVASWETRKERRITAGEDKAYDTANHVANLRASNVTPHVTQNDSVTKTGRSRESAIDGRTTRHEGYGMSQSRRAMIECIFGWGKQHGTMRKTKHRGISGVAADFMLNLIAYNLIRIPKLIAA
jgi:predicted transcriptional regulator